MRKIFERIIIFVIWPFFASIMTIAIIIMLIIAWPLILLGKVNINYKKEDKKEQ